MAQTVKNLPAIWETPVRSLGWEDPLEKKIATHFSILAWRIPWTEKPGGLWSMGSQRVGHDWATNRKYTHRRKICLHWRILPMIVHIYFYFNYHFYSFNVSEQKDQHLALRICASFKNEVGLWVIQFDIHFPIAFLK